MNTYIFTAEVCFYPKFKIIAKSKDEAILLTNNISLIKISDSYEIKNNENEEIKLIQTRLEDTTFKSQSLITIKTNKYNK